MTEPMDPAMTPPWVAGGMSCDDAIAELYAYLDGELTEERRALIAAHLDGCGPCGRASHFEAELRVVIQDRCQERVPAELVARVVDALEHGDADG